MKLLNISSGEDVILDDNHEEQHRADDHWAWLMIDHDINPYAYSNWELLQQAYAE